MKNQASAEPPPKMSFGFPVAPFAREFRIKRIQPDPDSKNANADHDGLPTERPAHFRNERAHFPNQPRTDKCFGEVKPVSRRRAEFPLAIRQREKNDKRRDAGERRRVWRFVSKKAHAKLSTVLFADAQCLSCEPSGRWKMTLVCEICLHLIIARAVADADGLAVHNRHRPGGVENDALNLGQFATAAAAGGAGLCSRTPVVPARIRRRGMACRGRAAPAQAPGPARAR